MKQIKYGRAKQSLKNKVTASRRFQRVQIWKCKISTRLSIKGNVTIATPKAGLTRWPPHVFKCPALWRSGGGRNLRVVFGLFFNRGKKKTREGGRSLMDCDSPLNSRNSPVMRRFLEKQMPWETVADRLVALLLHCCVLQRLFPTGGRRPPFQAHRCSFSEPL